MTSAFYEEYLESGDWRVMRKRALKLAHYRCERCGFRGILHVHHKTYARLGDEDLDDLQVLCEECHNEEHGLY